MSPRRGVAAAVAASVLGLLGCGGGSHTAARPAGPSPAVAAFLSPQTGGVHSVFRLAVSGTRPIGVWQHAIHGYRVRVLAGRLRNGCIVDTDAFVHSQAPGHKAMIVLDPSRFVGQQWCPGRFTATLSYYSAYACPARGTCRPPAGFASQSTVLARLRFTVAG